MIVYRTKTDLALHLDPLRDSGKSIGFVPTMGALHRGHASLVEKAAEENEVVVVSIFVNPSQFNDPEDLEKYPRTLDDDLELLKELHVDLVFVPAVPEIYPEGEEQLTYDLGGLDQVMEGKHRKGHFEGVVQVVSRLFIITRPTRAYFGQKDFQQLVIVRHLVGLMELEIEIVACPVIREEDGLAMSSRNRLLNKEARELAPFIHITLNLAKEKRGTLSPPELAEWVRDQFLNEPQMMLDYFEIVDEQTLKPVRSWEEEGRKVGCIAAQIGGIRLIDNLIFD